MHFAKVTAIVRPSAVKAIEARHTGLEGATGPKARAFFECRCSLGLVVYAWRGHEFMG